MASTECAAGERCKNKHYNGLRWEGGKCFESDINNMIVNSEHGVDCAACPNAPKTGPCRFSLCIWCTLRVKFKQCLVCRIDMFDTGHIIDDQSVCKLCVTMNDVSSIRTIYDLVNAIAVPELKSKFASAYAEYPAVWSVKECVTKKESDNYMRSCSRGMRYMDGKQVRSVVIQREHGFMLTEKGRAKYKTLLEALESSLPFSNNPEEEEEEHPLTVAKRTESEARKREKKNKQGQK
jgi:hypothetical protein